MPTPKDRASDLAAMRMAEPCKLDFGVLAATVLIGLSAAAHYPTIDAGADGGHPADLIAEGGQSISRPFDAERFEGRPGSTVIRLAEEPRPFSISASIPRLASQTHSALAIQAQTSDPVEVDIPAASLRILIARTLGKDSAEPIYRHEMAGLTALDARQTMRDEQGESIDFGGFRNLEGLQYAVNITSLDLAAYSWAGSRWMNLNAIKDIVPLAGLTKLTHLNLSGGAIRDISPLANLDELEVLRLWNNEITDLSPLAGLANLKELGLGSNDRLSDISPLANLRLERLSAYYSDIADVSPLGTVTTLRDLNIDYNRDLDISALATLVHLRRLGISSLGITDLSPLKGIHNLRVLYASGNDIEDVSTLSMHRSLETVWLERNNITDIGALGGLPKLEYLHLSSNGIVDVAPLKDLVDARTLRLAHNDIVDISPLAGLTSLRNLDLRSNRVSDIQPLVRNVGLGDGDEADLRQNLLSQESIVDSIPLLKMRGTSIRYDENIIVRAGDPPRIYGDNVFVLPVSENLASDELLFGQYVERLYSYFKDEFDFLLFLSNLDWREDERRRYLGAYFFRKNDVRGIGEPIHKSEQRLQGFIHFSYYYAIGNGPTLHELMHRWANAVVSKYQPHWGLTSADGILGGFNIDDLVDNGDGTYYFANGFSESGEALNSKPYSPIELYLAGFIGADDVPDLLELKGVRVLYDDGKARRTEDGSLLFEVDEMVTHTIEDLAAEHGWRVPHHTVAQRDFRAAAILLVDARRPATKERLDTISANVAWFSNAAEDDASGFNFYEATGGRGTMKMDDLSAASLAPE